MSNYKIECGSNPSSDRVPTVDDQPYCIEDLVMEIQNYIKYMWVLNSKTHWILLYLTLFDFIWLVLKLWVFMFHVNILTIEYQTVVFFLCWIAILYFLYIILLGTITSFLWGEFGLLCWVSIFVFLTSCSFHFIFSGNIPQTPTAWLKTQVFKALRFQRGLPNFKNCVFTKVELIYYMPYTYTYGTRLFDILRPW